MIRQESHLDFLLKGDVQKIKEMYKVSYPGVKKFVLMNQGTEADAEDVFQKALLQIAVRYRKEKFEIKTNFEVYLYAVCKNLWRRELNKSKNRVTNDDFVNFYADEQENALALVEQKRFELFNEKLKLISEGCQKALSLYFAKVPYAEIVKQLNYNSETVARQRIFKCKKKLSDLIKADRRFLSLKEL